MNIQTLSRTTGIAVLIVGLILGATVAYAATTTFKIKENKMFFTVITLGAGEAEDIILPSVVGRTGHVYTYVLEGDNGTANISPAAEERIGGSANSGTQSLDGQHSSLVLVADEANNTWWKIGVSAD